MGSRRKSRELAMQALFYMDKCHDNSEEIMESFRDNFNPPEDILPFFYRLIRGVVSSEPEIDGILERFSSNWKISRMSCVDRNILRIAVYELLWCNDIPSKVSINEAIDIGKKYGTDESGPFINGILDSIRDAVEKEVIKINN
ncbi:MAG: transcription antitermination factor NusB [Desulfobacterium sp.]|nr:transcription antitermination factor NusB [Desulfobacterium sp.]MBU3947764.1 transcription antitermination factor NusB [Pseudomonadota bacterium]MBU4036772.1 transcription antitermination factor NusB [Pseudomonadota bacterium]